MAGGGGGVSAQQICFPPTLPPLPHLAPCSLRNVGVFWMRLAMVRRAGVWQLSAFGQRAPQPVWRAAVQVEAQPTCRPRSMQYVMLCLAIGFVYFQVRM